LVWLGGENVTHKPNGNVIPLSSTDKSNTDKLDAAGHSILRLIGKAAGITEEYTQDVIKAAENVADKLRAARDRITQLEDELAASNDRAERAEQWLHKVHTEIEERFLRQSTARQIAD
jgi:hypothetical protein